MEILEAFGYIIDGIILYIYHWNFYRNVKNHVRMPVLLLCYLVMEMGTYLFNVMSKSILFNIVVSVSGVFLISLLYDAAWRIRIAGTFLFQAFAIASEMLANAILVLMQLASSDEKYIIGLFVSKIFLFSFSVCMQVIGKRESELPGSYLLCYMCIPLLSVFILSGMYQAPIPSDGFMYILAMCIVAINLLSYYLLNSLARSISEKKDTERIRGQLKLQQEKYGQLVTSFQKGSRIIHDFNKHLTYLHKCMEENKTADAQVYLESINRALKDNYYHIQSGNLVIDALLNDLKSRLDEDKCRVEIDVDIVAHQITISDYDLVTILGNVLENIANHAALKEDGSFVRIEIAQKRDKLVIHTVNLCKDAYRRDVGLEKMRNGSAVPAEADITRNTQRSDIDCKKAGSAELCTGIENSIGQSHHGAGCDMKKICHGTGQNTVRELVQQYGGIMEIHRENQRYDVFIAIPMGEEV